MIFLRNKYFSLKESILSNIRNSHWEMTIILFIYHTLYIYIYIKSGSPWKPNFTPWLRPLGKISYTRWASIHELGHH